MSDSTNIQVIDLAGSNEIQVIDLSASNEIQLIELGNVVDNRVTINNNNYSDNSNLVETLNTNGALGGNRAIFINTSGFAQLADCNILSSFNVYGFSLTSTAAAGTITAISAGRVSDAVFNFSADDIGKDIFLTYNGLISLTLPTTRVFISSLGYVSGVNEIYVRPSRSILG